MKYIKLYENHSQKRIPEIIIDSIEILSNYNRPFDLRVFECLDKLNNMTDKELGEFYKSVSSNRRKDNLDEENFMLDMIEKFGLVK